MSVWFWKSVARWTIKAIEPVYGHHGAEGGWNEYFDYGPFRVTLENNPVDDEDYEGRYIQRSRWSWTVIDTRTGVEVLQGKGNWLFTDSEDAEKDAIDELRENFPQDLAASVWKSDASLQVEPVCRKAETASDLQLGEIRDNILFGMQHGPQGEWGFANIKDIPGVDVYRDEVVDEAIRSLVEGGFIVPTYAFQRFVLPYTVKSIQKASYDWQEAEFADQTIDLCDAINSYETVVIDYGGDKRLIEPHCLGQGTSGNELLRAYQVGGGGSGTGWKLFKVDEIGEVRRTGKQFSPEPGYNPDDRAMESITCNL